ncbi:MAG TPA: hypothetical protein VGF98_00525 [Candidatus Tumulicola sp.]|jgi:hypothetical protein
MIVRQNTPYLRTYTLPYKVLSIVAWTCFGGTCLAALLFQPLFLYAEFSTALLLGFFLDLIAITAFIVLAKVAREIELPLSTRALLTATVLGSLLNPHLWDGRLSDLDAIGSFLFGIMPYGFPFFTISMWAAVEAVGATKRRARAAFAYAAVPISIALCYLIGGQLADRLVTTSLSLMAVSARGIPHDAPQLSAYQLDPGSLLCDCRRFIVHDGSNVGESQALLLLRRDGGYGCSVRLNRIVSADDYDVSRTCGETDHAYDALDAELLRPKMQTAIKHPATSSGYPRDGTKAFLLPPKRPDIAVHVVWTGTPICSCWNFVVDDWKHVGPGRIAEIVRDGQKDCMISVTRFARTYYFVSQLCE